MKRSTVLKKVSPRKKNQLIKLYATKGPRKVTKPSRNIWFKSSKASQKKRNLQANFEELDIARRNAAMNSSRKRLLREEEEQRKRFRYLIGLESSQEPITSGQPIRPLLTHTPDISTTNIPIERCPTTKPAILFCLKFSKHLLEAT